MVKSSQCVIDRIPAEPIFIKQVVIKVNPKSYGDGLWEDLADAATYNETVEFKLLVEGVEERITVEAQVIADQTALLDGGSFRIKVTSSDQEQFVDCIE